MTRMTLRIHGLQCPRCADAVSEAARCVAGISLVQISRDRERVVVESSDSAALDHLLSLIDDEGFSATVE
jgi:copper chaperone CopZ